MKLYYLLSGFFQFSGAKTYSDWFEIDRQSGLITTQSYLDCELEGSPKVIVVATDQVLFFFFLLNDTYLILKKKGIDHIAYFKVKVNCNKDI
jgi:hypothetical protein